MFHSLVSRSMDGDEPRLRLHLAEKDNLAGGGDFIKMSLPGYIWTSAAKGSVSHSSPSMTVIRRTIRSQPLGDFPRRAGWLALERPDVQCTTSGTFARAWPTRPMFSSDGRFTSCFAVSPLCSVHCMMTRSMESWSVLHLFLTMV